MNVIDSLLSEKKQIERVMKTASSRLAVLKPGRLKVSKNEQYYIFSETEKKWVYVRKTNLEEAKDIAQYEYDRKVLRESQHQYSIINKFISEYKPNYICDLQEHITPSRRKLISLYLLPDEEFVLKWKSKKYESNPYKLENGFLTQKGELVRSKSEVIIADRLQGLGIPYKYEYPLELDDGVIYPDFTLLNLNSRTEVVYEHFGRMDDESYVNKNFLPKINRYARNGFFLGQNLIVTFESSVRPFDISSLELALSPIFTKIHTKQQNRSFGMYGNTYRK